VDGEQEQTTVRQGSGPPPAALEQPRLIAYHTGKRPLGIEPASRWRDWMNAIANRWPNRCLPLLMANQAGWALLNPAGFEAVWNGAATLDGVEIVFDEPRDAVSPLVSSHFGYGILTWGIPYLFRTSSEFNLLVRGPANWPKDGICPLEGLVETDWATTTFTMNWKFTRPDQRIRFDAGEPFCVLVPQRRAEIESFRPQFVDMREEPDLYQEASNWTEQREQMQVHKFLAVYSRDFEEYHEAWEADYFKGVTPGGRPAPEHQTELRLHPFEEDDTTEGPQ